MHARLRLLARANACGCTHSLRALPTKPRNPLGSPHARRTTRFCVASRGFARAAAVGSGKPLLHSCGSSRHRQIGTGSCVDVPPCACANARPAGAIRSRRVRARAPPPRRAVSREHLAARRPAGAATTSRKEAQPSSPSVRASSVAEDVHLTRRKKRGKENRFISTQSYDQRTYLFAQKKQKAKRDGAPASMKRHLAWAVETHPRRESA